MGDLVATPKTLPPTGSRVFSVFGVCTAALLAFAEAGCRAPSPHPSETHADGREETARTGASAQVHEFPQDVGRLAPIVALPAGHPVRGILLVLHGYGSDGAGHQSFFPVAPTSGLVTIAPSGRVDKTGRRYWAANGVCCSFDAPLDDVDVTYVLALLDAAEARWSLPRGQVRLAGHSNGAALALRLACEHPERFSKVFAFAGPVDAVPAACAAPVRSRPPANLLEAASRETAGPEGVGPSIVIAHGRNDRVVPYGGGALPAKIHPKVSGASALGAEALVAALRPCAEGARDLPPLDLDGARPDLETTRRSFPRFCDGATSTNHSNNSVIELWSLDRVGHAPYAPTDAWRAALEEFFLR